MKQTQYLNELRALDAAELDARLKEVRTELFNLRFQAATGQLENHRQIRNVRRQIAQVLTVLQGRRLGIEELLTADVRTGVASQAAPGKGDGDIPSAAETATGAADDAEVGAPVDQAPAATVAQAGAAAAPETESTEAAPESEPGAEPTPPHEEKA